jgi:hypothetical protein
MRQAGLVLLALGVAVGSAQAELVFDPPYRSLTHRMLNTEADPFRYYVDGRLLHPATVQLGQIQAAVEQAYQTWQDVACAWPAFSSLGLHTNEPQITDPRDPYDLFNVSAVWITSSADPYYNFALAAGGAAAATVPLSYAGTLHQCDIYLNAVDFTWTTDPATHPDRVDLQTLILHEVGHCLGLGHSAQALDVMYAGMPIGLQRRQLTTRDLQKVCDLLPQSGAVGSPCAGDGGCQAPLHCVSPPLPDGGVGPAICTQGCDPTLSDVCPPPFVCKPSDLVPDAGAGCLPSTHDFVTQVGRPCDFDTHCGSAVGMCQKEGRLPSGAPAWKDGYCTQDCAPGRQACPYGSVCVDFGGDVLRCIATCRLGSGDCRFGYACVYAASELNLCWPACQNDLDCGGAGGTHLCRTCDGACVARQSPTGQVGDPCTANGQCGTGQVCLLFEGRSIGVCSQPCAHACTACPSGTRCHPMQSGDLYCLRDCSEGTCPTGLMCGLLPSGRGCIAGCESDDHCAVGTTCEQGQCINPYQDGGCVLCPTRPDGGTALPSDGGVGGGSSGGGCGCTQAPGALAALVPLALVLWRGGRRRRDGR